MNWEPGVWSTREEFFARLCKRLGERGVRSVLMCPEPLPPAISEQFHADVIGCPSLTAAEHWRYFNELGRVVRKYGVDTAHVRFYPYFSPMPWMAKLQGVPRILFTEANSGEWKGAGLKAAAIRARTALVCRPVMRYIAISQFVKQRMVNVGMPEERIDVVYNGVDTESLVPDGGARAEVLNRVHGVDDDLLILTASALIPWKHTSKLIEACALARKRGVPARLLIAGRGPLRPQLEAAAEERKIAHYCHFLGHTQVKRLLQGCDIFAHAAVGEAFGNVLAEAMSCGIPVVATNSGAVGEVVVNEETGLIVPPGDAQAIAAAFEKLAADKALRHRMGLAGRSRASRLFSIDASVEGNLRVYDEIWRS